MKRFSVVTALLFFAFSQWAWAAPNDVIILGDSIFTESGEIRNHLNRTTPLNIQNYAVGGSYMDDVITQYSKARANGIPRTIIMNGGGNDILRGAPQSCRAFDDRCIEIIDTSVEKAEGLWQSMANDGVENVIYLGYYYTKRMGAGLDKSCDYAAETTLEACSQLTGISCAFVDTRESFKDSAGLLNWDGIHPTNRGSQLLGDLIWQTMIDNGMEQY